MPLEVDERHPLVTSIEVRTTQNSAGSGAVVTGSLEQQDNQLEKDGGE